MTVSEETIRGKINRVVYTNPENQYSVVELKNSQYPLGIKLTGNGLPTEPGIEIIAHGKYVSHAKFGKQFAAAFAESVPPGDRGSMINFLSSGIFRGIGEKVAADIYDVFGLESVAIIQEHPYRLSEVPGIGEKKAAAIEQSLKDHREFFEARRYLTELNLTQSEINRVVKKYGQSAITVIKSNPYQLAYDLTGFGFKRADDLARRTKISEDDPKRISAGIYYALVSSASSNGHCYLTKDQLGTKALALLGLPGLPEFDDCLAELDQLELVAIDGDRYYLNKLYSAESRLAARVNLLLVTEAEELPATHISAAISASKFALSEQQLSALSLAAKHNLLIITGGPGSGKTTVVQSVVRMYENAGLTIKLAAPTGKAAQRMTEVCGVPATTIHRLLKFDPMTQDFVHNDNYPLAYETGEQEVALDLLIIDETSMLDLQLADSLFAAVDPSTCVILVGDKDQLPSVGPGTVFADLLLSENVPQVRLDRIFRQSEGSLITTAAYQVNQGEVPQLPVPGQTAEASDIYLIERRDTEQISSLVTSLFCKQIPDKFGIATQDITVLTATNRSQIGTLELNRSIQNTLSENKKRSVKIDFDTYQLGINDRVCQRVNNYQIDDQGVFNGDIGTIIDLDPKEKTATVKLWDGREILYQQKDLYQLQPAYALTIHRSQGSELKCVILVLHDSQFILLDRQLLYTAMTRAKSLLIIVGSKRALQMATKKAGGKNRNTYLAQRIKR